MKYVAFRLENVKWERQQRYRDMVRVSTYVCTVCGLAGVYTNS